LLTLSGHNGAVHRWETSVDNEHWTNIDDSTRTFFTAKNVTQNTWYRALIQSGSCPDVHSEETQITVFSDFHISGYATYENNPHTPLNGLKIILNKLVSDSWVKVDSAETNALGFYDFDGLTNATYGLTVKSAHPSGQWQTWAGVNNTDALIVNNHIAGTMLLPSNPPVIRTTASVKNPHPAINTADYTAIRQAAKSGWGYFDIPKWVFTGTTAANRIDTFALACANVPLDIRGLCAGDVNGSYVPGTGYKTAEPGLALVNNGTLPLTNEIIFPIKIDRETNIGAITLFLNYDPTKIDIIGVEIPGQEGEQPTYETRDGVLYIGWWSTNPLQVAENQTVLLIRVRLVSQTPAIHFTLNENPLSELSDGIGTVINGLKLSIPDAGENGERAKWQNSEILVYPNPAKEVLNIEFESVRPETEMLTMELVNLQGVALIKYQSETMVPGWQKRQMDVSSLAPGVYFLRANMNGEIRMKKVVISR
jgi:hypothetical protein